MLRVYDGLAVIAARQTSYDSASRPECVAVRMNPGVFSSLPASACALGTTGGFGEDRVTKTFYDPAGQVMKVSKAVGTSVAIDDRQHSWTNNGKLLTIKDARGNLTTYAWDGHDRLKKTRFPDKANGAVSSTTDYEEFWYDPAGNETQLRKRDGQLISSVYDDLNRRTLRDAPGTAQDVTFVYDHFGRRLSAAMGGDTVSFLYDALDRVMSETGSLGAVSYQYDAAGNNTRVTHTDGFYAQYDYNAGSELTAVKENGAATLASYGYDSIGRRASITRGNGVVTNYGFDGASRLASLANDLAGAANDDARTFARNPASQIIDRGASNAAYVYAVPAALNQSANFNGLNQPTSIGGASIAHDDRGNLTSDGTTSYAYDLDNRLVSASNGTTLAWDAIGRLKQTQSGATTTKLVYAGVALIAETNGAGAVVARYVHGAGVDEPLVWYVGAGTGTKRWLTADERGSIASVSDAAGNALAVNTYDEYGKPGPNNLGRFQYTGQQWIAELGLYHYKARFYAPGIGRFLQTDPIGYEDQMNLYAYVANDPVNNFDPSGLCGTREQNYQDCTITVDDGGQKLTQDQQTSTDTVRDSILSTGAAIAKNGTAEEIAAWEANPSFAINPNEASSDGALASAPGAVVDENGNFTNQSAGVKIYAQGVDAVTSARNGGYGAATTGADFATGIIIHEVYHFSATDVAARAANQALFNYQANELGLVGTARANYAKNSRNTERANEINAVNAGKRLGILPSNYPYRGYAVH